METFRSRFKNGNINSAEWQELYILTRHWSSDLEFYVEDLQFLQRLISKYAIWIEEKQNSVAVSKLISELHRLGSDGRRIMDRLNHHLEQLSFLMNGKTGPDPEKIIQEHEVIENEIAEFVTGFRSNRKEVYRLTEEVIDSEDLTPE